MVGACLVLPDSTGWLARVTFQNSILSRNVTKGVALWRKTYSGWPAGWLAAGCWLACVCRVLVGSLTVGHWLLPLPSHLLSGECCKASCFLLDACVPGTTFSLWKAFTLKWVAFWYLFHAYLRWCNYLADVVYTFKLFCPFPSQKSIVLLLYIYIYIYIYIIYMHISGCWCMAHVDMTITRWHIFFQNSNKWTLRFQKYP